MEDGPKNMSRYKQRGSKSHKVERDDLNSKVNFSVNDSNSTVSYEIPDDLKHLQCHFEIRTDEAVFKLHDGKKVHRQNKTNIPADLLQRQPVSYNRREGHYVVKLKKNRNVDLNKYFQ